MIRLMRCVVVAALLATGIVYAADAGSGPATTFSPKSAGEYLDGRMAWWIEWKTSARAQGTFCVSCHTALPYALGRQALHTALGETGPSLNEVKLIENVSKRVGLWQEIDPFYNDEKSGAGKALESRGTESILNALVLVSNPSRPGSLTPSADQALRNMWALQIQTGDSAGAWPWLQFHNAPWEGDSQFFGATLAALAVGSAPVSYRSSPDVEEGLSKLKAYLSREQAHQKLIDRVMLLWASAKMPGLISAAEGTSILGEIRSRQQADGGFSLSMFVGDWKRRDDTSLEQKSDGYATAVVSVALLENGAKVADRTLKGALAWLKSHQEPDGRWLAYSLNKQRDLASDPGKFMSDAATAYAVLALRAR